MDQVAQEFASELRQRLGQRVRQIVLFGSRARKDFREDSDYDMLVIAARWTGEDEGITMTERPAPMARLAGVRRVDEHHRHARHRRFVGDELAKLEGVTLFSPGS